MDIKGDIRGAAKDSGENLIIKKENNF